MCAFNNSDTFLLPYMQTSICQCLSSTFVKTLHVACPQDYVTLLIIHHAVLYAHNVLVLQYNGG